MQLACRVLDRWDLDDSRQAARRQRWINLSSPRVTDHIDRAVQSIRYLRSLTIQRGEYWRSRSNAAHSTLLAVTQLAVLHRVSFKEHRYAPTWDNRATYCLATFTVFVIVAAGPAASPPSGGKGVAPLIGNAEPTVSSQAPSTGSSLKSTDSKPRCSCAKCKTKSEDNALANDVAGKLHQALPTGNAIVGDVAASSVQPPALNSKYLCVHCANGKTTPVERGGAAVLPTVTAYGGSVPDSADADVDCPCGRCGRTGHAMPRTGPFPTDGRFGHRGFRPRVFKHGLEGIAPSAKACNGDSKNAEPLPSKHRNTT